MVFPFRLFPARRVCFSIMTGLQPAKNDLELCCQYRSIPVGIFTTRNTSFCSLPEGSKYIYICVCVCVCVCIYLKHSPLGMGTPAEGYGGEGGGRRDLTTWVVWCLFRQ